MGTIMRILQQTGLEPEHLELELTESVVMRDAEAAAATLHRLRQLGIHISIDDFGTGYSSLSHLKRFPLEKLKIDKLFVSGLCVDANDRAITSAIIALAHSLQLTPIAEGVETFEQLEVLRSMGCVKMQGYLFSGALTVEAATRLLRAEQRSRTLIRRIGPTSLPDAGVPSTAAPTCEASAALVAGGCPADAPFSTE